MKNVIVQSWNWVCSRPELVALTGFAVLTRLWQFRSLNGVVFDEVYFRRFAGDYLTGTYFFDIHPPLVKLLFAAFASVAGVSSTQLNSPVYEATIVRLLPIAAGVLLVPLMYLLLRRLGQNRAVATLAGLLVLCDNGLLVESRYILMDSLLLLFGFGALYCFVAYRQQKTDIMKWRWFLAMAVLSGMAVSTKWTGLATVGLIFVAWLIDHRRTFKKLWRRMLAELGAVIGIMALIYVGCFAMHFALLTKSGTDDGFMTQQFQSTLQGSVYYDAHASMSFWQKLVELNVRMYTAQSSLTGVHNDSASPWYTWPLDAHPIFYWHQATYSNLHIRVYLLGNPAVWWLASAMVIVAIGLLAIRYKKIPKQTRWALCVALAGYALNFLPFIWVTQTREMYIYHYFFALMYSIIVAAITLSVLCKWHKPLVHWGLGAQIVYVSIASAVVLTFLFFSPLSYHVPMTLEQIKLRQWLPDWREDFQ